MNEEIDESDFYHEDFTTASDWEIFIAHMEEIINQWRSNGLKDSESKLTTDESWYIRSEKIVFIDCNFDLIWYKKISDEDNSESTDETSKHPLNTWHDFVFTNEFGTGNKDICLAEWYGLNEYIVISPAGETGTTSNESRSKVLLSSACMLINNLSLEVPIFIQIRDKWQKLYMGVYEASGIRTNFNIVHLKKSPHYCHYLPGLLDMFKSKIMSPCSIEDIIISFQATYMLENFGNFTWKQSHYDNTDVESLFLLPFGVFTEPVNAIKFKAVWNHISEHSIVDTESYSDFIPLKAPKWYCSAKLTSDPVCLLGDCLNEFSEILNINQTVYDILGDYAVMPTPESNPLDILTESAVPTISTMLHRATRVGGRSRKGSPPLSDNRLVPLLYYLFPDADENSQFLYGEKDDKDKVSRKIFKTMSDEFKSFKTCPEDSLIWRLSIILSHCLESLGGIKAFCHVWYEFVQEMRYRWEKCTLIPGVPPGMPDLRTCLLNQKLQLLNCCIDRKMAREFGRYSSAQESEDSDDEFFDANEDGEDDEHKPYPFWDKPVGRLSKFGELKLIKTGDPLYIPFTQDPVLKTEDQLEEDTDALLKLGSNQEASELRARIMSASLLSDMESFKAANPGAIIEDFIRWYSPRDWIEEDELDQYGQKKGHLSTRMQLADNIWVQMWKIARPVPANRQKRLFDDTREAEKVLQFLDFRTVGQIAELIIPNLSQAAICRLMDEIEHIATVLPDAPGAVSNLLKHGEKISRDLKWQSKRFEAFVQDVAALELSVSQANSLLYKLNPSGQEDEQINQIIGDLVAGKEVNIQDRDKSQVGSRIISMFGDAERSFNEHPDSIRAAPDALMPAPVDREFVLRANCVRPNLYSARSPQFLRVILAKNEFRLVGAFSEDTAFF